MRKSIIPHERIEGNIYLFRGRKVMIDFDLAALYGVSTKKLNQAVVRNKGRFPEDFSFQLSSEEFENLRSQIVTSSLKHGGRRFAPRVFTEQGVAMLSSVLRSKRAIQVNIQIMRTFSKLREMLLDNDSFRRKLESMEKQYDEQFKMVFDAIRNLLNEKAQEPSTIGFRAKNKK